MVEGVLLMVNKLLTAVTKQLGTTFGSKYHYYVEDVKQDLQTPCFTVDLLLPLQRSKSPVLYDRTMPLVIHYFSDSETVKNDCYLMGEQIIECLEYLPFESNLIRGENISWQLIDDVLQVFITYKFTTIKENEIGDPMDTLDENVTYI